VLVILVLYNRAPDTVAFINEVDTKQYISIHLIMSQNRSVSLVTGHGLEELGFDSRQEKESSLRQCVQSLGSPTQ
jgi:hypothetical protein